MTMISKSGAVNDGKSITQDKNKILMPVFVKERFYILIVLLVCAYQAKSEVKQVEVQVGFTYSMFAKELHSNWQIYIPNRMGGHEWNRMIYIMSTPFIVIKNNSQIPLKLKNNEIITIRQPKIGIRLLRNGAPLTSDFALIDEMFDNASLRGEKYFNMKIHGETTLPEASTGLLEIPIKSTVILAPSLRPTDTFGTNYDWAKTRNDVNATIEWKGHNFGYHYNWVAGALPNELDGLNGVAPSRLTDVWDVDVEWIDNSEAYRLYVSEDISDPPYPANNQNFIDEFPFRLSTYKEVSIASEIQVLNNQQIQSWQVKPIFSILRDFNHDFLFDDSYPDFDSDGNGINDLWEIKYFGMVGIDPDDDPDNDGQSNLFEYIAGTSPIDPSSKFMKDLILDSGGHKLNWTFAPNRMYRIESSNNLKTWSTIAIIPPLQDNFDTFSYDLGQTFLMHRYYRVKIDYNP